MHSRVCDRRSLVHCKSAVIFAHSSSALPLCSQLDHEDILITKISSSYHLPFIKSLPPNCSSGVSQPVLEMTPGAGTRYCGLADQVEAKFFGEILAGAAGHMVELLCFPSPLPFMIPFLCAKTLQGSPPTPPLRLCL